MSTAEPTALPPQASPLTRMPRRILSGLSVVILAVAALILFASVAPRLLGFGTLAVTSGSMGSAAPIGSLVVARWTPAAEIRTGDVIVAQREEGGRKQTKVLHRVISLERDGGVAFVRTKGDANPKADPGRYALPPRVLTQAYTIPYLGYLVGAIHIPLVWMLVVGLPAIVLAMLVLRDIWRPEAEDEERRDEEVEARTDLDGARVDLAEQASVLAGAEAALAEREQRLVQAEARNAETAEALRIALLRLEQERDPARGETLAEEGVRPVEALQDYREAEASLAALERELDRRVAAMQSWTEPESPNIVADRPAVSELTAASPRSPVHLLFVPQPSGYGLVERAGEHPAPGAEVAIAASPERRFFVAKVARSPLPGDDRPCVYLLPT